MKDIKGYEGLYAITEDGRVWGYKRKHFLSLIPDKDGYLKVGLSKDNKKKSYFIHRLVAETYISNPNNLPQVNHIDEIKQNNNVNNLEWCDYSYNVNYGTRNKRISKPVYCEELNKVFESATVAAKELQIDRSHISSCCKGNKIKSVGGYHFKYKEVA